MANRVPSAMSAPTTIRALVEARSVWPRCARTGLQASPGLMTVVRSGEPGRSLPLTVPRARHVPGSTRRLATHELAGNERHRENEG